MTQSGNIFETFMPHGQCYLWRADILWLNVLSDAVIALSYLSIPAVLLFVMSRRVPDVPFARVVYMFCLFIFACGITHLFSIWTVWHGQYGLHGLIKAFTAAASLAAVILLFPILPKLMALRSPAELEFANAALREQIELRKLSEAQSIKLQNELASLGRIQSVGKMATGLAHELNQPLLVIATSADTATQVAKQVEQNEPVLYECLEDIQKEAQRASDIIRTLRQFVVSVTVRDNGPGLMSGVDPFNAVDTDKNSGLGVGLSISRNIVESHGGTLVHNSNPIGGASFTFSLPVSVS